MAKLNTNSFIHFRKTTSVDFAKEFSFFNEWLYAKDSNGSFINIENVDGSNAILSSKRQKDLPSYSDEIKQDSSLNSIYFLDDIKVIYFRGIPYDSASDYITTAEFTDSSVISVDKDRHILYIPKAQTGQSEPVDENNLSVAYIHQVDETGTYNPNLKDASLTVYVKGETGKTFTIKQSMVAGDQSDEITAMTYWGLKNYIDSKVKDVSASSDDTIVKAEWIEEV